MNTEIEKSNIPIDEPPLPFAIAELTAEQLQELREPITVKSKAGRKPKLDKEAGVFQIRGVDQESKNLFEKASKRANKTAGQFFNTEVREFLQGIVKKAAQPPATEQDLKTILNNRLDEMQEAIKRSQQQQITPEDIAEKVAEIMAAKPEAEKKGMLGRIMDAVRGA